MAMKRVIVYVMHEHELALATQTLDGAETSDSIVIGSGDEQAIQMLRDRGLVVEEVHEPTVEQRRTLKRTLDSWFRENSSLARLRSAVHDQPAYYLLTLDGPLLEPWRQLLADADVHAVERQPNGALKVRISPEQIPRIHDLSFVRELRPMNPADSGPDLTSRVFERARPEEGVRPTRMLTFDIRLNQPEDFDAVQTWLVRRRIPIAGSSRRKIRIHLLADSPAIEAIPALDGVARLEEFVPPKLHNDVARRLMAIEAVLPTPHTLPQTGAGQIVAVADTGLDAEHPDFAGRIVAAVPKGAPTADDPHGHGTHVAGSVLGDGSASGGQYRGAAPGANLYFQALLAPDGSLGGLPVDLGDLFEEAYLHGARIHNNSWGSATESRYTMSSSEVDEFVAKRRDMLVVFSGGNEGNGSKPLNAAAGFIDWLSIGSPASSKNALTVGASRSDRTKGGYSKQAYGTVWPAAFPHPPIAHETVSGDPECIAAFSSRGPCDDRRIKPDLVAPGTDIVSARSSLAPLRHFWGAVPGQPKYGYMGGTSMAAPLVSGCAALVREYYQTTRQHSPSAALVKATLINGTRWLNGADAQAPAKGTPNFHQGFGRVDVSRSLPNHTAPAARLEFEDDWQPGAGFNRTGETRRYELQLGPGTSSLRVCLAYTDHPARALQNNLNLFLERPDLTKVLGNEALPNSLKIPDPDNNVEIVRLDAAPPGTYRIQVIAANILKPPQDFALVILGDGILSISKL